MLKYAIGYAFLISVGIANAADADDSSAPMVRWGGVNAYPGFSLVEKSNNNIFNSNTSKLFSFISVISPSVVLKAKEGADAYLLSYSVDVGRYNKSYVDNYIDHSFLGSAEFSSSTSERRTISLVRKIGHDERGSTFGPGTIVPSTWHSVGIAGSFMYGAEESRGKIVLDAGYLDRKYQNNRLVTTAYDKTLRDIGGAFYFRILPKTSIFTQATHTGISYKDITSTLNGNERRYLVGATWDATAQTSGNFKIGRVLKRFDGTSPTYKGASWSGSVRWAPRKFARVDWVSGRSTGESTGVGDFILITNNILDFGYDLSERTSLHFNAGKVSEVFKGAGRIDITKPYGFKAEYKLRTWLVGGVEYTSASKTSTDSAAYYDRRIIAVSVRTQL